VEVALPRTERSPAADTPRRGFVTWSSPLFCHWLPFQPTINLGSSNGNRFISRSLKSDRCGVSASGVRNHHGPTIAAGTRKNEKLNTFVVHRNESLPRLKLAKIFARSECARYGTLNLHSAKPYFIR
jgi:hypothetical protein